MVDTTFFGKGFLCWNRQKLICHKGKEDSLYEDFFALENFKIGEVERKRI